VGFHSPRLACSEGSIVFWKGCHLGLLLAGLFSLLGISCIPALPQAVSAVSNQAPAGLGLYRIAGIVVNSITGEPVRHATVAALAVADSRTVETAESGEDGRFSLDRLPAAKYQLTASKRGFQTSFYNQHEAFSTAIVTGQDQQTEDLTFRLVPSALLRGVVTADGGDPVEGARVALFLKTPAHSPAGPILQASSTATDDTGAYEFANLAPGDYFLAVTAEPWYALHRFSGNPRQRPANDPAAALDVAYPITFFDSTVDEASATPIVLAAGGREEANISLHAVPALHLALDMPPPRYGAMEGLVTLPSLRQTVFGTEMNADNAGPPGQAADGSIAFTGVAPGHYELQQGDPPRVAELDATTSQQIAPDLGTPTVSVSVTVRNPSDAPGLYMNLQSVAAPHRVLPMQATPSPGASSFNQPSVPPGDWNLMVFGPGSQAAVISISVNGKIHPGNTVNVRDRPLSVVATVSRGETRIEGFARKEMKGLAGVMVVLAPRDPSTFSNLVRRDQSDSDGSFALFGVVPGQYTVVAIENGWDLDWSRPEGIARYLPKGVAVTITEASGQVVRLPVPVPVQPR
jgi:protocatechuate 3,4-dioxygenase beta subunit